VKQRQDHFDGSNPSTWQQAYYVNDTFWKPGSDAPVFLCVGGEGPPMDGSAVVRSEHCNVAVEWMEERGALMFALEHRYYGCHNESACPVANLSTPGALRYLSSRQALGDIASFVEHANQMYGSSSNKWVTWGGSYPGMLAGWARLKFPHLIHASVSSSAPVRAELDMRGYNDVVGAAYAVEHEKVGGSLSCQQAIAVGHAQIRGLFATADGREFLAELFHQKPEYFLDKKNQYDFAGQGVADFPAQSNDPACREPMCNIARICVAMTNTSIGTEVHRLAAVVATQTAWKQQENNEKKLDFGGGHGQFHISQYKNKKKSEKLMHKSTPGYIGADLWGWQTCAEFGFYQTCEEGSKCIFTQGLSTLDTEMEFCEKSFGIPKSIVADNIAYSNEYYGSDHPKGSRVLYVNGEVDPWHANAIDAPLSGSLPAIWVPGASHHAWTHPSKHSDQDSVVEARLAIRRQVDLFLIDPIEPRDMRVFV